MVISKRIVHVSLLLAISASFMVSNVSAQQAALKFAFIDVDLIFEKSDKFVQTFKDIKKIVDESKKGLEQMNAELKSKVDDFQVQKELLNEENAKQRKNQITQDQQKLIAQTELEEKKFQAEKARRLEPVLKALQSVVDAVAKEDGYTFVFKRSNLAFGDPSLDITKKVTERLDKMTITVPPAAAPAAAPKSEDTPKKNDKPADKKKK